MHPSSILLDSINLLFQFGSTIVHVSVSKGSALRVCCLFSTPRESSHVQNRLVSVLDLIKRPKCKNYSEGLKKENDPSQSTKRNFLCFNSTHLHLSRLVVASIFVFISSPVAIAEEAFEAILASQFSHDLVEGLTVEGIVIHSEGWVADSGKQGCVCVLSEAKCSRHTNNKLFDNVRICIRT